MNAIKKYLTIALIALAVPVIGWAQATEYQLDENSKMVIYGTSNVHDWEAEAEQIDLSVSLHPDQLIEDPLRSPVSSLTLNVPVKSIQSGKGGMDKRIHKALKLDDHPEIIFTLISAEPADTVQAPDRFFLNLEGNLNIAGTVKKVSFPVKGTRTDTNTFHFAGIYNLNMTTYEVDPPSAMFGAIKSGEEVSVEFDIILAKRKS